MAWTLAALVGHRPLQRKESQSMKKFQIRKPETVKVTAAAAYPWWMCIFA